jgi:diguanylate cyclase (GGDEF)-like protein
MTLLELRQLGGRLALFFIDLDNFKNINDVFGHHQGDDLLLQVSQRFASILGSNDSLFRLGSDEFVLLMEHFDNDSMLYLMANRIQAVLKKPFLLEFKKIYVNASIGISLYPGDGESSMEMIRSADMAMHKAKREGKNKYILFTRSMHDELYEKFRIENGIRYGLLKRNLWSLPAKSISPAPDLIAGSLDPLEPRRKLVNPPVDPIAEESSLIDDCAVRAPNASAFLGTMKQQE